MSLEIDRRAFIASLGGVAAINLMGHEERADALEDYTLDELDKAVAQAQGQEPAQQQGYPTMAQLDAQVEARVSRRGVGNLFVPSSGEEKVKKLKPMPSNPTT